MTSDKSKYNCYQIYKDNITGKYGVRNTDMDITIVQCVFDKIEWFNNSSLVRFTMQGLQSICNIDDLSVLMY